MKREIKVKKLLSALVGIEFLFVGLYTLFGIRGSESPFFLGVSLRRWVLALAIFACGFLGVVFLRFIINNQNKFTIITNKLPLYSRLSIFAGSSILIIVGWVLVANLPGIFGQSIDFIKRLLPFIIVASLYVTQIWLLVIYGSKILENISLPRPIQSVVFWIQGKLCTVKFSWLDLFFISVISAFLYVLSEWVFIITKPSFLDTVRFEAKVGIFFFTSSSLVLICCILIIILFLLTRLGRKDGGRLGLFVGSLLPASILTFLALLLLDNFTNTVIGFGISDTKGIFRIFYLLIFVGLFLIITTKLNQFLSDLTPTKRLAKHQVRVLSGLIAFTVIVALLTYRPNAYSKLTTAATENMENKKFPNIILLTTDALNASHMSAYGYELDTTPTINELVKTSLVVENAFSNSNGTDGSTISIFTGKYPSQTRVLYAQDILKGIDSYQHLPGLLRSLGYYNVQFSHNVYGDVYRHNLLDGFDQANGRSIVLSPMMNAINRLLQTDRAYFIYEVSNRLTDRLLHILLIKPMASNRDLVKGTITVYNDLEKMNNMLEIIQNSDQPVFSHLHFMVTHGPLYEVREPYFSKGLNKEDQEPWNTPFYDDSILQFDGYIKNIITELKESGEYENTIIIIGSDHGQVWSTKAKIPLIIHFPDGQFARPISINGQNLDIAPTILDYLGISVPEWMVGRSLIRENLVDQPILSFGVGDVELDPDQLTLRPEFLQPPFYQFGVMTLVTCDKWYEINLRNLIMSSGKVQGYAGLCTTPITNSQEAYIIMKKHLQDTGFDVTHLTIEFPTDSD